MLLKSKKHIIFVSIILALGYGNVLRAEECGVLRYLENKSNGVAVSSNKCKSAGEIAVGSEFNLMPGARLWFKSQLSGDAKTSQGICQNRSSKAVHIRVNSEKSPWITPIGLTRCSAWGENKINCEDSTGGQSVLSCVIAGVDTEANAKGLEERTTSVRMRSLPALESSDKNDSEQNGQEGDKERIIAALQPDADLCRAISNTDTRVKISWLVEANSRVSTVIPDIDKAGLHDDAEKRFVDCLTAAIKGFAYPQSAQAVWLSNQF
ncbi:MAG: hypothetical protein ACXWF8_18565 [Methylobacter sp.]